MDKQYFRGFIRLNPGDKRPRDKFKGDVPLFSTEDAEQFPDVAGVIADDSVLIDIDDAETSERLFNLIKAEKVACRVVKTTRGRHFFFRNTEQTIVKCATGITLALGIKVDIKCGLTSCYAVVKQVGTERPVEYDAGAGEVPAYLTPCPKMLNLASLGEGSRNTSLFKANAILQRSGFSHDDAQNILALANAYILAEPIDEAELATATRSELSESDRVCFWDGDKFLKSVMAEHLISSMHIVRLNGSLHVYDGRVYTSNAEALIQKEMLRLDHSLKRCHRAEVLDHIDKWILEEVRQAPSHMIAFQNGVYDMNNDVLMPFSPDLIVTNLIPHDFNDDAYDERVDTALGALSCDDPAIRRLMLELAGYCLYRRNSLGKFFILTGSGSNGKSTFLKLLRTALGRDNCSALDLAMLDDRFSTVMLHGKLANLGDDISDEYVSSTAMLKKIVTGEMISAEQKGKPKFDFEPTAKLVFSANAVPRIGRGRDNAALMRRLVIIPFGATFTPSSAGYKMNIDEELAEESAVQYFLRLALDALKGTLARRQFTQSDRVDAELREFEESNSPLIGFIRSIGEVEIVGKHTSDVYALYESFCEDSGLRSASKIEMSRQLCRELKLTTKQIRIGDQRVRIFEKL